MFFVKNCPESTEMKNWNVSFVTGRRKNDLCLYSMLRLHCNMIHSNCILLWRSWPEQTAVGFKTLDAAVTALVRQWGELGEIWDIWERVDGGKPGTSKNPVGTRSFTPPGNSPHSRRVLRFVLLDLKLPGIGTVSSPIPLHLHASRVLSPHLPSVYVETRHVLSNIL